MSDSEGATNSILGKISIKKVQRLTLAVHKVTDFLVEGDVLRETLGRESVTFFSHVQLASNGSLVSPSAVLVDNIRRICGLLNNARDFPALRKVNIDILIGIYDAICKTLAGAPEDKTNNQPLQQQNTLSITHAPSPLSDRQQFILHFAGSHKQFQLRELIEHFPSLSEKTIRNDLVILCEHRLVQRFGVAPRSYYQVMHDAESGENGAEAYSMRAEYIKEHAEAPIST